MKRIASVAIITLSGGLFFSLQQKQVLVNYVDNSVASDDSIMGVYIEYNIKYGEFIYDDQSGIEAHKLFVNPDTISIHSLNINANYKFVETYHLMHTYEVESSYSERSGTWSFFRDTLTLSYEKELRYQDKTKRILIDSLLGDLIIGKHEKLILVHGVQLWDANSYYSHLNLLKQ